MVVGMSIMDHDDDEHRKHYAVKLQKRVKKREEFKRFKI